MLDCKGFGKSLYLSGGWRSGVVFLEKLVFWFFNKGELVFDFLIFFIFGDIYKRI